MRICADESVGVGHLLPVFLSGKHGAAKVLEVDLMADPGAWRHDPEVVERVLAPPEENITLVVPLELALHVDQKGRVGAILVDLNRVVDHQVHRLHRIDLLGITAEPDDGVAHGGEVDHGRYTGKIL